MKAKLTLVLLTAGVALGAAAAAAVASDTTATRPSHNQVVAAVNRATHSKDLWATINICSPPGHHGLVGVRGQMPSLGFPSRLVMVFGLLYWSSTQHAYAPVRDSKHAYVVGRSASSTVQYGISYTFSSKVTLIGQVTFKWFRNQTELGETTLFTTGGHKSVSDALPPSFSASTCSV